MHAALDIPEIVSLIFGSVGDPDSLKRSKSRDLAALSCVCRGFLEPALDALWEKQISLYPFMTCLPADLWTESMTQETFQYLELRRPLYPSDWERPMYYAKRVKHLDLFAEETLPPLEIMEVLALSYPAGVLFPNLRQFSWSLYIDDDQYPYLPLFLGPRLFSIAIDVPERLDYLSLLPTIPLRCPNLVHVELRSEGSPLDIHGQFRDTVSLLIRALQWVEDLHIVDIDQLALVHLSRLESVKRLWICWPGVSPIADLQPHALQDVERPFASLTSFTFFPCTREVAETLLGALACAPLEAIEFCTMFACTPQILATLLDELSDSGSAKHTLGKIAIEATRDASYPDFVPVQLRNHLPLSTEDTPKLTKSLCNLINVFTAMRYIKIYCVGGFDLTDALLLDIAAAWGRTLEFLWLAPEELTGHSNDVTLAGIHAFVQRCSRLSDVRLQLNAVHVPSSIPSEASCPQLHALGVSCSPISNSTAVARYLVASFPKLETIDYHDEELTEDASALEREAEDFAKYWGEVQAMIEEHAAEHT
ncbi:hypothetical protein MKEN_00988400 [Mycena kentingensis (nom. inval.)]|nr:hypothetical protein MKEN_00988400 [Mycena kentingensis (nom. inval.)]